MTIKLTKKKKRTSNIMEGVVTQMADIGTTLSESMLAGSLKVKRAFPLIQQFYF